MTMHGTAWKVPDRTSATDLVPAQYDKAGMSRDWIECSRHVLEDVHPGAAGAIADGDLLIAGSELGAGHAHYFMTAIMGCVTAGFSALLADSVNALFLRAAIDAGVAVWAFPGISTMVSTGDEVQVDLATGHVQNLTTGRTRRYPPVDPTIMDILRAGGSEQWALQSIGAEVDAQ